MDRSVAVVQLVADLQRELGWSLLHPGRADNALSADPQHVSDGAALVGFLSFIRSHPVQVLGQAELDYLLSHPAQTYQVKRLRVLVLAEGVLPPADWLAVVLAEGVSVLACPLPARKILVRLQQYLQRELAPRCHLHGVLVDVLGVGILIQGEAGIGKSELALELVSRNHRLIADDSVLCILEAPGVVTGHCPPALQDFMEVRGLGIVNIRQLFGAASVIDSKRLRLVVEIRDMAEMQLADIDRLQGQVDNWEILGVPFPRLRLPVSAARNLAVLVEAAARAHYVRESGIDMLAIFDRQTRGGPSAP